VNKKEELLRIGQEIRDLIEVKQKELELSFVEDDHIYYIKDKKGVIRTDFPSVSTVIKQFYNDFPALDKSLDMCNGDIVKQDELLKEWTGTADYANSKGSRVHYLLEMDLLKEYGSYKEVRKPHFECDDQQTADGNRMIDAGHNFIRQMHRRGAVLLDTEMVLGSSDLEYTGQPDKMWIMFDKDDNLGVVISDWKGLPLDTPILTDSGWKDMGTLNKSDKVYDKDGDLVNIMNISQVKNKKCLKIKFDNNEEVVSDFEHRWLIFTSERGVKKEKVMTTQEIKDYNDNLVKRVSYKILKIDNPKPLNNSDVKLPIDPYVLGIWLGDGHSIDAKITQANESVWEEINKRGYEIGKDLSQGGAGKATTRTIFNLQGKLRETSLLSDKHIPEIYLSSSYEQRLDLLRGLMDSDGTYNKTRNNFVMETTREGQADYTVEIVSSLGIKPTKSSFDKKFNGKIIKCYRTSFVTSEFNPFLSRNQDLVINPKKDRRTYRTIVSVEEAESVPTKCIEVDSPSSTFLCGKSLLVTHNTNKPKNFQVHAYTEPMLTPFENYMDTALSHYMIQLPLYIRLFLDMLKGTKYENIKVLGGIIVHLTAEGVMTEYRIPKAFSDTVLTMPPLPRIKEVMAKKYNDIEREKKRIEDLDKLLKG
tara:strand:+ start:1805 stop:3742 length:1938 start_codon:yes stop_codon:yes gene_type:complete